MEDEAVETNLMVKGVLLEVDLWDASQEANKILSEAAQKHGWEEVLPKAVSEYTVVSNERHVRQHGAGGISLNPPGARWVSKVLVYDVCLNRQANSADE